MDIVVVGRHTEIKERFNKHVEDKLAKVEKLAPHTQRIDVVVTHERNPRQANNAERVEITLRGKGPVIRAEAAASDRYGALDLAQGKLLERLRRMRDRAKDRNKRRPMQLVPETEPEVPLTSFPPQGQKVEENSERVAHSETGYSEDDDYELPRPEVDGEAVEIQLGASPVVIREKVHSANPMTIDDAIYEMELVGHDFFLFIDAETGQPSACYRRRGWTYGVIRLAATPSAVTV